MRLESKTRDKTSPDTPYNFSLKFLLWDNADRVFTSIVLIFIFLRFPEQLLHANVTDASVVVVLFIAFVIGLINDQLILFLKRFRNLARKKYQDASTLPPSVVDDSKQL